jgi:hypothetical protein
MAKHNTRRNLLSISFTLSDSQLKSFERGSPVPLPGALEGESLAATPCLPLTECAVARRPAGHGTSMPRSAGSGVWPESSRRLRGCKPPDRRARAALQ